MSSQGEAIQILHPKNGEEITILVVPDAGDRSASEVAEQILALFQQKGIDPKVGKKREIDGGHVFLEIELSASGTAYAGIVLVM